MTQPVDVDELDLSDAELMEVLKNHGVGRRTLMATLGAGAGIAALGGTAAASAGKGVDIDPTYGAPYADGRGVPSGLVDHVVTLHVHAPGDHADFPLDPEGNEIPEEFFFDPVGLHVSPGDVVEFRVDHHLHTVTSWSPKWEGFPDRTPTVPFSSPPISDGDSWLYRVRDRGVIDYNCLPHVGFGMVGRLVSTGDGESAPDDPYGPLPIPNSGAVYAAPEMTPSNIVAEGAVAWADLTLP